MTWTDEIYFDENGLVPVIVQDAKTERVLMFAGPTEKLLSVPWRRGKECISPSHVGRFGLRARHRVMSSMSSVCSWTLVVRP